jgi:hypothetical protein
LNVNRLSVLELADAQTMHALLIDLGINNLHQSTMDISAMPMLNPLVFLVSDRFSLHKMIKKTRDSCKNERTYCPSCASLSPAVMHDTSNAHQILK